MAVQGSSERKNGGSGWFRVKEWWFRGVQSERMAVQGGSESLGAHHHRHVWTIIHRPPRPGTDRDVTEL